MLNYNHRMKKNQHYHTPAFDSKKACDQFLKTGNGALSNGITTSVCLPHRNFYSSLFAYQAAHPQHLAFPKEPILPELPKLMEGVKINQVYTHQMITALQNNHIKMTDISTEGYHEHCYSLTQNDSPPRRTRCWDKNEPCLDLFVFDGKPSVTMKTLFIGSGFHGSVNKHINSEGEVIAVKKIELTKNSDWKQYKAEIDINRVMGTYKGSGENYYSSSSTDGAEGYVAMSYFNGRTLSAHYLNVSRIRQITTLILMKEIAIAVSQLHRKNVIHNDLYGGNILINFKNEQDQIAKVIDFGMGEIGLSKEKLNIDKDKSFSRLNHLKHFYWQDQFGNDIKSLAQLLDVLISCTKFTSQSVESEVSRIVWGMSNHHTPTEHVYQELNDVIEEEYVKSGIRFK